MTGAREAPCCCAVPDGACALPARQCAGEGLPALSAAPCCASGSSDALPVDGGSRSPHLPVHLGFAGPLAAATDPLSSCVQAPRAPFRDPPEKVPI